MKFNRSPRIEPISIHFQYIGRLKMNEWFNYEDSLRWISFNLVIEDLQTRLIGLLVKYLLSYITSLKSIVFFLF